MGKVLRKCTEPSLPVEADIFICVLLALAALSGFGVIMYCIVRRNLFSFFSPIVGRMINSYLTQY